MVAFPQQIAQQVGRLPAVDLHEERPQVLAHEPPGRTVRLEVDTIVFDPFLLPVDSHGVFLHPTCQERLRILVHGDDRRIDGLGRCEAIPPEEHSRSSSKDSLSMSLFIGTSAWIVPASSSISPPLILTATPNRSSASLIFLSMYACSSGVYFARFRGSLKYRRAARAWNGVCTGYFQFAGSPYFSGSF